MLAYLNDKLIPYSQAAIPVGDLGFTMGVTVTEQLRTFNGTPHLPERHLARLREGLKLTGIDQPSGLLEIANDLTAKNFARLNSGSDLSLGICITPGASQGKSTPVSPTVLVYNLELPFANWANQYSTGMQLTTVETREVSGTSIPKQFKCRSRMHYYLAELEANQRAPGSRALMLDQKGNIAEATTASVAIIKGAELIAPPVADVLPSIAFEFSAQLATKLGIEITRRVISTSELTQADEVLWLSTPMCVLPVSEIDKTKIGSGKPGPVFSNLIKAWSEDIGLDIVAQARSIAGRGS